MRLGITLLLTPILSTGIFAFAKHPNLSNKHNTEIQIAQGCDPKKQTCCKYAGKYYSVNQTIGPRICRPDGTWGTKS